MGDRRTFPDRAAEWKASRREEEMVVAGYSEISIDRQQNGGRAGGREALMAERSHSDAWVEVRRCWKVRWEVRLKVRLVTYGVFSGCYS